MLLPHAALLRKITYTLFLTATPLHRSALSFSHVLKLLANCLKGNAIKSRGSFAFDCPFYNWSLILSSRYAVTRVRTLFQKQFSRTFPELFQDSNTLFQDFKMHNNWSNKPLRNTNPKIILKKIVFKETFITRVYRFPGLSRTCINFPGLSSPGKCQNKIPGLSRISRTRTYPALRHVALMHRIA